MMRTVITCDRCGQQQADNVLGHAETWSVVINRLDPDVDENRIISPDLCQDCRRTLKNLLDDFMEPPAKSE